MSTPAERPIRSAPPANRLVSCCQARVPGASVTTIPATRPNQSNPATALATRRATARLQPPQKEIAHAQGAARAPPPPKVKRRGPHAPALHHPKGNAVEERLPPLSLGGRRDPA